MSDLLLFTWQAWRRRLRCTNVGRLLDVHAAARITRVHSDAGSYWRESSLTHVTSTAHRIVCVFTAWCILVQSAVLRSHVVCLSVLPSVCPSVTLVNCDHIGWNSSKIISLLVRIGRSLVATLTYRVCSKGNTPKFGPKVTHSLLIWASETFDRKLRPNGYR